jgi:hypothetical protein
MLSKFWGNRPLSEQLSLVLVAVLYNTKHCDNIWVTLSLIG